MTTPAREQSWECGQCLQTGTSPEGKWLDGWLLMEDDACYYAFCSVTCALKYLENMAAADADPKLGVRDRPEGR